MSERTGPPQDSSPEKGQSSVADKLRALPEFTEEEIAAMGPEERKELHTWIIGTLDRVIKVGAERSVHLDLFGDKEDLSGQAH